MGPIWIYNDYCSHYIFHSLPILTGLTFYESIYIKRQENYTLHSLVFPLKKVMSLEREMKCFLKFLKHDIPVPEPIYYEKKRVGRDTRAILIIKNLDGYEDLNRYIKRMQEKGISPGTKRRVIASLAEVIKRMHGSGYLHGALFGKHIFVRENEDGSDVDVRLIDLEFVRWHPNRMQKDLSRLYRRLPGFKTQDAVRFLMNYLGEERITPRVRRTAEKIRRRLEKKARNRELKNSSGQKKNKILPMGHHYKDLKGIANED